jgi:biotin carboxyl carrier protein
MGQPRHRGTRQAAAVGNLKIAKPRLVSLEAAQDVECPRHYLDDVILTRKIASELSLFAKPLGASSHPIYNSVSRNKIPLAEEATSGNLRRQQKAEGLRPSLFCAFHSGARGGCSPENGMPEIKIVTEVAGRICALPVQVGGRIGDGEDVVFVEAMKMEIPVAAPAAGRLKSILVNIDDVVAEGQVLAIIET